MAKMRDSQRRKLYRWERYFMERYLPEPEKMSLDRCKDYITAVCIMEQIEVTAVTCGKGKRTATYSPMRHEINLPDWAKTHWVCLHELAHAKMHNAGVESHGPEYVKFYCYLLQKHLFNHMTLAFIERDAFMFGLRLVPRKNRRPMMVFE